MKACNEQGIEYKVVKTYDNLSTMEAKKLERRIKAHKKTSDFCPVCLQLSGKPRSDAEQSIGD